MNGDCLIFALLYLFVGIVTVFPHFKKQWKTLQVWKHRRTVFCIVAIGSVAIAPIGLFFMLFFHAFYGRPSDTKKQE